MQVLFVTSAWPADCDDPRGSFVYRLARGLSARGFELSVVAPGHPTASETSQFGGVTVHRAMYARRRASQQLAVGLSGIVPNLRRRPWLAAYIPLLVRALTKEAEARARGADLVHAHWLFPGGIAGVAAARVAKAPLIVTCHGSDVNLALRIAPLAWWARPVLHRADVLAPVSHALHRGLLTLGADPTRIRMSPLGVDLGTELSPEAMPAAWREFRASRCLRVLFAGGLSRNKSPETLIEAVRILQVEGHEVAAAFLGDGPRRSSLERAATGARNVWIVGNRPPDEVATWMDVSDVLVLPSFSEGRGLVLVEAMARGRAVVASDIPGPDELVHDDRTGFRFPAGNATALADRLRRFITDSGLAVKLGGGGRHLVESEGLLMENSIDRYAAMYEELAQNRQSHRRS